MYSSLFGILNKAIEEQQQLLNHSLPKEMYEPMSYIIGLGGKRVRPLLTLIGCDVFEKNVQTAIPSALAVELFHNFSLIHDDILDKAPLRRGSSTVHEKWTNDIALLSGDGMLVKAFDILSQSSADHLPALLKLFSKTSLEVCEGQQLDMNFETLESVSVDQYIHMITFKTAVLLGCSLQLGAICAGADLKNQQHLYDFGKHVGIAFQILDDVLDVYAVDGKFGKQVGGDILSNKKTFLLLNAFEMANESQSRMLKEALQSNTGDHAHKIEVVTGIYNQLGIKELALQSANNHTDLALNHLNELEAAPTKKDDLKTFALHLLNRDM
ncbi:MAG: geranyl transferase [Bacteroidota bacterium]|nr:geranyl transferase [Bacteroidota bacterium]